MDPNRPLSRLRGDVLASRNAPRTTPRRRLDFASIWCPMLVSFSCHLVSFSAPVSLNLSWPHLQTTEAHSQDSQGCGGYAPSLNPFWHKFFIIVANDLKSRKIVFSIWSMLSGHKKHWFSDWQAILFFMFFKNVRGNLFQRVHVPNFYKKIASGAIFDFHDFQNSTIWTTSSPKQAPQKHRPLPINCSLSRPCLLFP